MKTLIAFSLTLLTGCAGFNEAWREHAAIEAQWATPIATPSQPYFTPMNVPQPSSLQPNFGNTAAEQYQTIMVNTPQGMVYKRCKVLNGKVVACF